MYIERTVSGYDRSGEQVSRRAKFLLLMQTKDSDSKDIRGIIRKVALRQLGNWMMGRTRIGSKWYTVSGSYGSDGLPMTVEQDAFDKGTKLPNELYDAWSKGEGWNSTGNEAPQMLEWALTL